MAYDKSHAAYQKEHNLQDSKVTLNISSDSSFDCVKKYLGP